MFQVPRELSQDIQTILDAENAINEAYKRIMAQSVESLVPLSDDKLSELFDKLGGVDGFMKDFGYRHFARAVEEAHGIKHRF